MSFGYTPTIPATNDDPADDQPLMQQNFASINSLINVNHAGFSSLQAGQHNQVTFAGDFTPALPTPIVDGNRQGILFTNTVGGGTVNQLFYYAGSAAQSSSQYVPASSGSTFLLGGIILKWGSATVSGGLAKGVSFASSFPTNCFQVVISVISTASPTVSTVINQGSPTTTGFQVNTSGSVSFSYFAIGN